MTARVTIRPGSVTWNPNKPPTEPVSAVFGKVRVTIGPVDTKPDDVQASGLTCDEILQRMGSG